jgi:hypothetical protein
MATNPTPAIPIEVTPVEVTPVKAKSNKKPVVIVLIVLALLCICSITIVGGLFVFGVIHSNDVTITPTPTIVAPTAQSTSDLSALISQNVATAKASITLPYKIDAYTTWTDVTAETGAVRYHYTISGTDTSSVTNTTLKASLVPTLCNTPSTKAILDEGVNMEYQYTDLGSSRTFFVTVTQADCN